MTLTSATPSAGLGDGKLRLSHPPCAISVPFIPADASSATPQKLEFVAHDRAFSLLCAFQGTYSTNLDISPSSVARELTGLFWFRLKVSFNSRTPRLQMLANFVPESPLIRIHGFERIRARMAAELRSQL